MTTEGSSEASDVNINDDLSVARIVEIVQGAAVLQEVPGRRRIYNGTLTGGKPCKVQDLYTKIIDVVP